MVAGGVARARGIAAKAKTIASASSTFLIDEPHPLVRMFVVSARKGRRRVSAYRACAGIIRVKLAAGPADPGIAEPTADSRATLLLRKRSLQACAGCMQPLSTCELLCIRIKTEGVGIQCVTF